MSNRHNHDEARRNAEETLAMVNADLRNPKHANNARRRHQLTHMKESAMRTIAEHDRMYRHANNDSYNDNYANLHETVATLADAVSKILPHITGEDEYDAENRRRYRRYGRGRTVRVGGYTRRRPGMDAESWDDDDYNDETENRRSRDRFGRFMESDEAATVAANAAAETARRMTSTSVQPTMPRHERHEADATGIGPGARGR